MIWNRCIGLAALAAGEGEEADRHLAQALAELDRVDFREPAIWRVDGDAIEAAIMVGALDRATSLTVRFEDRPNAHGSPGAWPSRRVAAVFSWPRAEIWRVLPDLWSGRSPSTSVARCRSSWLAPCSPTGRSSAA